MRINRMIGMAVLAGLMVGCGSGLDLGSVTGTVTYKDAPLKEGTITFHSEKGRPAVGKIVEGKITDVTTENLNDGVAIGPSRVTVQAITNAGDMYAKHKSLVPDKYGDPAKSQLKADIKSGSNDLKFDLK